ncbi:hypothetical protein HIM_05675 [Hirsutella minnesotensis 3608]|uniref:Uncharacterized protein n=1 Tax=Hirsutella minnesotensis 3608 TaxID=1043627 RepID=A0A0F8A596_9HYPO|nr:hypothetical protein HIM_05675 [Hirsutella minnesotensis 3608]
MATFSRGLKAPSNLPELVRIIFAKARADKELHYFPTQVALLSVGSIPFQLRFSPALANKPKGPRSESGGEQKPADPFAHPPASLFIGDVGPAHYLVLNKFAVVPEHFILATREFKQQTHVLEESDLEATLACIKAFRSDGQDEGRRGGLFAFFNSGEHSGASQPHRHIQLLPVARMRDGLPDDGAWNVLAERPDVSKTPFVTFSETVSQAISPGELHAAYLRLYRQACQAATGKPATAIPTEGEAVISYNMAMTETTLVVCPRRAEGDAVRRPGTGQEVGRLALNGTVLAGTALVKNEAEWDVLREDPKGLVDVLAKIGVPREEEGQKRCAM